MPSVEAQDRSWLHVALVRGLDMSKDPQRGVGAVLVSVDGRQSAVGYNGLPTGVPDTAENWARPRKYDLVVHAEVNAVVNCPFDPRGGTLYCVVRPCHRCLGPVANAGVRRIVFYSDNPPFAGNDTGLWSYIVDHVGLEAVEYTPDATALAIADAAGQSHDNYEEEEGPLWLVK